MERCRFFLSLIPHIIPHLRVYHCAIFFQKKEKINILRETKSPFVAESKFKIPFPGFRMQSVNCALENMKKEVIQV